MIGPIMASQHRLMAQQRMNYANAWKSAQQAHRSFYPLARFNGSISISDAARASDSASCVLADELFFVNLLDDPDRVRGEGCEIGRLTTAPQILTAVYSQP